MDAYARIVAASDFSDPAAHAVHGAAELARRLGSRLVLAHVYDAGPFEPAVLPHTVADLERTLVESAQRGLAELCSEVCAGLECETVPIAHRSPSLAIADLCRDRAAGLCTVGTHGRSGFERWLIGSVAEQVLRHAPCDVLVVGGEAATVLARRILVGTDLSPASLHAISRAAELARLFGAEVVVAHVFDPGIPVAGPEGGLLLPIEVKKRVERELRQQIAERFTAEQRVSLELLDGVRAAPTLCRWAHEHDVGLIVVGAHGRSALARLLVGSTTERVARHAGMPVLAVRGAA